MCVVGREEGSEEERKKRRKKENMKEQDGQDRVRTETKSKERGVLIVGAIMGLVGNLEPGKFSQIHKE